MQKKGNIEEKLLNVSNYKNDLSVESTLILDSPLEMPTHCKYSFNHDTTYEYQ